MSEKKSNFLKVYFDNWLHTHKLKPWKYHNYLIVIALFSFWVNICFLGLPIAPLFSVVGGAISIYLFLHLRLYVLGIDIYRIKADYLFLLVNSLINGILQGYLYLLFFYMFVIPRPSEIDWLNFGIYEFLQHSPLTKVHCFLIFSLIGAISYFLGGYLVHQQKIAKPIDWQEQRSL